MQAGGSTCGAVPRMESHTLMQGCLASHRWACSQAVLIHTQPHVNAAAGSLRLLSERTGPA